MKITIEGTRNQSEFARVDFINLIAVNAGPTAVDDTASVGENDTVNLDVIANDTDPDLDNLIVSEIEGTSVDLGDSVDVGDAVVTLENNGTLTVAPDTDFVGDVTFSYTVSDGILDDEGSVSVTVNAVNEAPTANDDTDTTLEDSPVTLDVVANDTDPENDDLNVTAINGASISAGQTVDVGNATVRLLPNGRLTVTPDAEFSGDVTFAYTVSDGELTDQGSATVTVNAVNDAPEAADNSATVDEDSSVNVAVLNNDSDPENDDLTVTEIDGTPIVVGETVGVTNATVTLESNGTLTVTPDADFSGDVSFGYTVSDGNLVDMATVSVTVNAVIDEPTDGDDNIDGDNLANIIFGGEGNDTLAGFGGDDLVFGEDGNDIVAGGAGDDLVDGGDGDDDVRGGVGEDVAFGGEGNDLIRVGADDDVGYGGNGNDRMLGAAGDDVLFGEAGTDEILGGIGDDILDGGKGVDILQAGDGNDTVKGGAANDTVLGQGGDDTVSGGTGNDTVNGAAGNDRVFGGAGNDTLNGGSGDDILEGGAGNDEIRGQAGMDTFVFNSADEGSDNVFGYEEGETIRLEDFGYTDAEDAAADFVQVGDDVVFENGGSQITFVNTTLFTIFDGIQVTNTPASAPLVEEGAAPASRSIAPVDQPDWSTDDGFDGFMLVDDADFL